MRDNKSDFTNGMIQLLFIIVLTIVVGVPIFLHLIRFLWEFWK